MSDEDHDIDARFRALIRAGFDDDVPPTSASAEPTQPGRRPTAVPAPRPQPPSPEEENPSSLLAAWDRVDAIDEGPYRPAHLDLGGRWPFAVVLCVAAMAAGLVGAVLHLCGLVVSATLDAIGGAAFFGGLAGLLVQAFRRHDPRSPDDEEPVA